MPTLHWLTRDEDLKVAKAVPYRLLEEVPSLGAGDPATGNLLIQGDNLEALKALLPFYAGQVKCIYIDPPYNTRSAFEHYDDSLEHTQWLAMMWPRLELPRELLSDEGSLWISIDDNEGHYLKVIVDELFGRKNFVELSGERIIRQNHRLVTFHLTMITFWSTQRMQRRGLRVARHPSSFHLPTATDKFYPDFVGELVDGRFFAVEYKGAPYATNDDSNEKRTVGALWEKSTAGKGIFLMAEKVIGGKDARAQLLERFASPATS